MKQCVYGEAGGRPRQPHCTAHCVCRVQRVGLMIRTHRVRMCQNILVLYHCARRSHCIVICSRSVGRIPLENYVCKSSKLSG
jgi:hypothetical protein